MTSREGESTEAGGMDGAIGTFFGDDSARLVSIHLRTLANPRALGESGLKNRPSRKCTGKGKFSLSPWRSRFVFVR